MVNRPQLELDGGDMTSMTRVPAAEISGLKGTLMKRMATRTLGKVPSALGVYWHNPKVLMTSFGLGGKVQKWDACDAQLKSFAHMAVASMVGCSWCLDYNYFQAHNEHLDLEKAREVPRWHSSDAFTALEREVMAYAEAMSQTPPAVTDEMSARLLEQLRAPALVELTAVIAFANLTTRANVAFGIESDGFARACGLSPLAQPAGLTAET
jgi:alkylhydroperoxidase family enzyme